MTDSPIVYPTAIPPHGDKPDGWIQLVVTFVDRVQQLGGQPMNCTSTNQHTRQTSWAQNVEATDLRRCELPKSYRPHRRTIPRGQPLKSSSIAICLRAS